MTQQSNFATKALQAVAVLLIAAVFVGLGIWQLQRAADLKNSLKVATTIDTKVVSLESVTAPREAIPATALNKTVSVTGHYIANFKAPNQIDGGGKDPTLFKIKGGNVSYFQGNRTFDEMRDWYLQ